MLACALGFGIYIESVGRASGLVEGYAAARDETAAATWANTPQGKAVYQLAQAGSIDTLTRCNLPGWRVKKGGGYPDKGPGGKLYGWRLKPDALAWGATILQEICHRLRRMLTNSYLVALGIPLILLLCGALAKKLVRGGGWKCSDFFLGVELALASLGSAMVYFFDLQKAGATPAVPPIPITDKIGATASFLAIAFFLMLWVLSTHQDWEGRTQNPRGQIFWLGLFCNGVGIGLFFSFVMLVKGI